MKIRFLLYFGLLAVTSLRAVADNTYDAMKFSRIDIKNGLSHNFVCDICQDTLGTVWFATQDGLNRFDGNRIRIYRHTPGDKHSIQSNNILKINRDSENNLWICTSNGLARYDAISDNFQRIDIPNAITIENIIELEAGKLLVATRNASFLYDSHSGSVFEIKLEGKSLVFYSACRNSKDIIVCTKAKTVETLNFIGDSLVRRLPPVEIPKFGIEPAPDIHNKDTYWIATKGFGLLHINVETGQWKRIPIVKDEWMEVFTVEYDNAGKLWVGTDEGLFILDGEKVIGSYGKEALGDKMVRYVYNDSNCGMWAGTNYGGVSYWNPRRNKFKQLNIPGSRFMPDESIVTYLHTAEDSSIWVGTRYDGLFHYYPGTGDSEHYDLNDVRTLQYSRNGDFVYTGAEVNGLHRINLNKGTESQMIPIRDIMSILPAEDGKFWLGTLIGLYLYDEQSNSVKPIAMPPFSNKLIRILTLFQDRDGNLWVGAKESLRVFKISEDNTLTNITPLCIKNIVHTQCIYQASNGTIWIGNADGLIAINRDSTGEHHIRHISKLTAATVRGIEEDSSGQLWVSTDNGLNRYNPYTDDNRLYNYNDGLCCSLFNTCAHCSDKQGNLYFGGIYGAETFKPEDIKTDSSTFRTILTDLIINNMRTTPNDATGILEKNFELTQRITLKHWQNSITISFASPDLISWDSSRYMYMLKGFDSHWTQARGLEATYPKLPKGKYTFLVKAANNDGVWNDSPTSLEITIRPVWYKSTLSIILFILTLCGAVTYAIIMYVRKKVAKKEAEKATEIEDLKREYEEKLQKNQILMFIDDPDSLTLQDEKFLAAALSDIEKNLSNKDYSVETLASNLCISRGNLHLRLKSSIGKTPVELIKTLRMKEACALLKDGNMSLTDIAAKTGFDNSAYFITVFKKTFGETPGKYRSRIRNFCQR